MTLRFRATLLPVGFEATALNDSGLIVGTRKKRAVVLQRGRFEELTGRADARWGRSNADEAKAVSGNGIVAGRVGWVLTGAITEWPGDATLWHDSKRTASPAVPGYSGASFLGVNARGEAVGMAWRTLFSESRGIADAPESDPSIDRTGGVLSPKTKALYWEGKTLHNEGWGTLHAINDLGATVGTLDGLAVYRPSAKAPWKTICRGAARAISPNGTVCGDRVVGDSKERQSSVTIEGKTKTTYFPLFHGFLWRSGKLINLPPLPSFDESRALGVHDAGWVVGTCALTGSSRQSRATLWIGGKPTALDRLVSLPGWKLAEALAVTPQGRILCAARNAIGDSRSVLLAPMRA